jgi:hypothetical protein
MAQPRQEVVAIVGIAKDVAPLDATGDDVMHCMGGIESRASGHAALGSKRVTIDGGADWQLQVPVG